MEVERLWGRGGADGDGSGGRQLSAMLRTEGDRRRWEADKVNSRKQMGDGVY